MDPVNLNVPFYVLANGVDPNSSLPVVTIEGNSYNLVPASFLANSTGQTPYVVDQYYPQNSQDPRQQIYQYNSAGQLVPVANTGNYLIVPTDFSVTRASGVASYLQQLSQSPDSYGAALSAWNFEFKRGGPEDLQRNYDGQTWDKNPNMFVLAFQNAASWYYGFAAQQSGLGLTIALGGAKLNIWLNGGPGLPQSDINEMNAGAAFGTSLGKQGSSDTVTFALSGADRPPRSGPFGMLV